METGVDPFGVFRTIDYGDVVVSPGDVIESHKRMTDKVKEVLDIDGIPVMLGGDHSITFANVRAFAKKYKNIGMIHIDTHVDCAPQGRGQTYQYPNLCKPINANETLAIFCAYVIVQTREHKSQDEIENAAQGILTNDQVLIGVPETLREISFEVVVDDLPEMKIKIIQPMKISSYMLI